MGIIKIAMARHQTNVTTHEIITESPIGINKNGEKGKQIVRYLTTLVTPNNVEPLYWVNKIEHIWVTEC